MPRKEARIFTTIWQDDDFTALTADAQRMYMFLLSQPELSMCGTLTLAENRWAASAPGLTRSRVRADLDALQQAEPRPFVVTDYGTDEVLIRSFMRRDRVMKSPKLARPLGAALLVVRSQALRTVLRDELQAAVGGGEVSEPLLALSDDLIKRLSAKAQVNTLSIGYTENRDRSRRKEEVVTGTTDNLRPEVEQLCSQLADAIEANGSRRPPVGKAWRDACRLMIDKDGLTAEQIARAITWCQADEFWRSNILSMPSLRRQYDRLRLAAQRGSQPRRGAATTDDRVQAALRLL